MDEVLYGVALFLVLAAGRALADLPPMIAASYARRFGLAEE
jgi:hypothetical protein